MATMSGNYELLNMIAGPQTCVLWRAEGILAIEPFLQIHLENSRMFFLKS